MTVVNRLLGLVLGLALAAAGVILVGEVVLAITERGPWLLDRSLLDAHFSQLTWSNPDVLPISILLLVAGLLLVLLQLKPRRPAVLPLPSDGQRRAQIERRGVESRLTAVAKGDDDVVSAKAKVGRRRATIRATAEYGADLAAVEQRTREALAGELNRLGLDHALNLKVRSAPRPR